MLKMQLKLWTFYALFLNLMGMKTEFKAISKAKAYWNTLVNIIYVYYSTKNSYLYDLNSNWAWAQQNLQNENEVYSVE